MGGGQGRTRGPVNVLEVGDLERPRHTGEPVAFAAAGEEDAAAVAALRTRVAEQLTLEHGKGHWSLGTSAGVVAREIDAGKVLVARHGGGAVVATLTLGTRKPWAIDRSYFTPVERPIYLTGMAVDPSLQRGGLGRRLLDEAHQVVRGWPAQAVRLDAYDTTAGAGGFYRRCGYGERGRVTYRGTPLVYFEMLL